MLAVPSSASGSTQSVALSVTGTSPAAGPISVSATALNWAISDTLQDITLTNTGSTPLSIRSVTVSDPHYLIAVNTCGSSLPAQSLCTISVAMEVGSSNATLTINDDAATGPQTVSLTANYVSQISTSGTQPTNGTYDLGPVSIGSTSSQNIAVNYTGAAGGFPTTLFGTNPGDFTVYPCSPSPCSILIYFKPTGSGVRTAKLGTSSGYFLVKGVGVGGTAPQLTFLSPGTVTVQGSFNEELTQMIGSGTIGVVNSGGTTMNLTCSIFSSAATFFYRFANSCAGVGVIPQTYSAGESGEFYVSVEANISGPVDYTGTLVVRDSI